jgi:surfactin synthase thioesterase subunit
MLDYEEFISTFLPMIRSDFCISETYEYIKERPLNCSITALVGLVDDTFSSENLLKWKEQTSGSFKHYFLPGDHFFIKFSYKEVIKIINQILLKLYN